MTAPGLAIVLSAAVVMVARAAPQDSRLIVLMEVPASCRTDITLEIRTLELRSTDGGTAMPLRHQSLSSLEIAGHQLVLAEARVTAGAPFSLEMTFGSIGGLLGVAPLTVAGPGEALQVASDIRIARETCETIHLVWRPAPLHEDTETYMPDIARTGRSGSPLGSAAYVTCRENGLLLTFDRRLWQVDQGIFVGAEPMGMAYSERDRQLYVALAGSDEIAVVDAMTQRLIRTLPLGFGDGPERLLISRTGDLLFVLNRESRSLVALSTWSHQEAFRLQLANEPRSMVEDPSTGYVYIASEMEGRVELVDPARAQIVGTFAGLTSPVELAFDAFGDKLFVASATEHRLVAKDLKSGSGDMNFGMCGLVAGLAFDARSRRVYAAVPSCQEIAVLQPDADLQANSIRIDGRPLLMAFDRDFRQLVAVLENADEIVVCTPSRAEVVSRAETCRSPYAVIMP